MWSGFLLFFQGFSDDELQIVGYASPLPCCGLLELGFQVGGNADVDALGFFGHGFPFLPSLPPGRGR
nr:MAG TPA: hypothetical protein [Caudoviricetes sp.]